MQTNSWRVVGAAVLVGASTLGVYWLADTWLQIGFNPVSAAVFTVFGAVVGAILGTSPALREWKTREIILAANLGMVFGILYMGWSVVWNAVAPLENFLPGLRDVLYGFWFIAGIVVPYIVRKPGSALAGETLAAVAELIAGSQWGLTLVLSGIVQGGASELVFAATRWRGYSLTVLMLASAAAGVGSLAVDYALWYSTLAPPVLGLMLVLRLISAAILGGWLGKAITDALARTGVLSSFAIGRAQAAT